jgi:hypothetical protein
METGQIEEEPVNRYRVQFEFEVDATEDEANHLQTHLTQMFASAMVILQQLPGPNGAPVFGETIIGEENEADIALRKLTQNRGNQLWIEYLQSQLKAAQTFK